jgi:cysteine desulfurase
MQAMDLAWGNPSSVHTLGRQARAAVEGARREVAALLGASPDGVVFTSGGTEGDNLAVLGLARAASRRTGQPARVVSTRLEHPAVLGALSELERTGAEIVFLPVDGQGLIDPAALQEVLAARRGTALVTIAAANHEIGSLAPIAELARIAHSHGAWFHSDAVQAVGRVPIDVPALDVDALTVSAHKIGGPKGTGALWVRPGLLPEPLVTGGRQERERRAGTENVPGILGFGAASQVARAQLAAGAGARIASLRDRLEARLLAIPRARRHGPAATGARVPGTANLGFAGALGELVVIGLDLEGVAVSSGAACSSGTVAPSSVLLALGLTPVAAREAVRFSLGAENTADEIDRVAALVETVVARVRAAAQSP